MQDTRAGASRRDRAACVCVCGGGGVCRCVQEHHEEYVEEDAAEGGCMWSVDTFKAYLAAHYPGPDGPGDPDALWRRIWTQARPRPRARARPRPACLPRPCAPRRRPWSRRDS